MPTNWEIQQQNAAKRAAIAQQSQQEAQDMAMQQYANQLAQWQYEQQMAQWQASQQQYAQQQERSDTLSREYQKKLDEANQKNESRYQDILAGRYGTRDRVLNDLKDYGKSQIDDANDRYKSVHSQMQANIYSRGFGGSPSMLNSAQRSAENSRDRELNRINDDIITRRTQADASQSDSLYGFMERRNDVPPDLNQLIQLQQGLGRSGPYLNPPGGYGGGYGGNYQPQPYGPPPPMFGGGQNPNYLPNPGMRGGNINRNFNQNRQNGPPQYFPNGGMLAQESLPGGGGFGGVGGGVAMAAIPNIIPSRQQMLADQQVLAMRNAKLGVKQALDNRGAAGDSSLQFAQNQAIAGGQADWSPAQTMPLIPGMAGGAMGAWDLLPSLPYGGYGGGRYGRRKFYPNYGQRTGYGDDLPYVPVRRPRKMPVQPMVASNYLDYPVA